MRTRSLVSSQPNHLHQSLYLPHPLLPLRPPHHLPQCPIGLINSIIRLRALVPASGALDSTCAPINELATNACLEPIWPADYYDTLFPSSQQ